MRAVSQTDGRASSQAATIRGNPSESSSPPARAGPSCIGRIPPGTSLPRRHARRPRRSGTSGPGSPTCDVRRAETSAWSPVWFPPAQICLPIERASARYSCTKRPVRKKVATVPVRRSAEKGAAPRRGACVKGQRDDPPPRLEPGGPPACQAGFGAAITRPREASHPRRPCAGQAPDRLRAARRPSPHRSRAPARVHQRGAGDRGRVRTPCAPAGRRRE